MAAFKYQALSASGERISGVVESYNEFDAVARIKETAQVVLKIQQIDEEKPGLLNMEIGGNKLNPKAFTVMCSQFAIILRSGIPIARAAHLVADKTTDKPLKKVLKQVAEDVEAGRSLSKSFEERGGKLLPGIFIETLRAGEESGGIDKAFDTMYKHYDKDVQIRGKVRSALAYPIFVLVIAVAVVIVLMVKVVPTFTAMFADLGAELPLMTRMLIAISDFFRNYILYIVGVIAVVILAYKLYGNTEEGRLKVAQWKEKIPVLGNINVLNSAVQFADTMSTMLASGIPLNKAVSITAKVIDNYYVSQEVGKLATKLEEGRSLGASMRESGCLPDILTDMTAVGEETGEMEETLRTIGAYYENELQMAMDAALKKLEPTLLVGLAVIAGFIVIAIYMAMFEMYAAM